MTSPERWSEIQRVLDGALDQSSETRTAFIEESCGDDIDLHDQVLRLVQACERAEQRESVLASPASELALPMLADLAVVEEGRRAALMDALKEALSSRYAVERVIRQGGMSTVFLAHDLRHDRAVAVKVLARDVVAPAGVERFLQEIRVTARLNHPHVLPVHDSGEVDGLLYFVMPYVEGETLRARLNSNDHLSLPEILRLLRELADALAFAHARGVVHRDLKPENVLLSGGHAVVGDFGIAKALTDAAETGTMQGAPSFVLGTPAYMAPEQADGTIPTDHRCDLYAFGLVAYELLAGVHPFSGRSGRALLRAQLDEMPRPLDTLRPDLPPPLVSLVMQCLAKSPSGRPDTAGAVLALLDEALRQLDARRRPRSRRAVIIGLAAVGVLALSAGAWIALRPDRSLLARGTLVERQPLVVADFQAVGADSAIGPTLGSMFGRYLGESRLITVLARNQVDSVLRLMRRPPGTPLDPVLAREVAQRAGVRAVVTGDLAPLGRRYVLTVRLVSATTGDVLASYHEIAANDEAVIPLLDRMGRDLRRRIGESLRDVSAAPPLKMLTTASLPALRSLSAVPREPDGARRIALVREAIALDSMFAYAYLTLANFSQAPQSADMRDTALTRAYLLRDQLTQSERTTVTAFYWSLPGRDRLRAIEAYEAQIARGFGDRISVLNVGSTLNDVRRFARTDSLMRRFEAELGWLVHRNLALAQIGQGKIAAADSTIARLVARPQRTDAFSLHSRVKVALAMLRFDSATLFVARLRATNSSVPPLDLLIPLARVRGRVGEARTFWPEAEARSVAAGVPVRVLAQPIATATDDLWLRGRPADARRRLDSLFRTRAIASLGRLDERIDGLRAAALYAASGHPDRARSILAGVMAAADSVSRRALYPHQQVALGEIAIAEGRPHDAMAAFRRSDVAADGLPVSPCVVCVLPALARAAERVGWADSSRVLWERYVTTASDMRLESDSWFLAMAYRELRRLYAEAGNGQKSADFDRRLGDLWRDADPELRQSVSRSR
jgi:serine/threonine-protein kinase